MQDTEPHNVFAEVTFKKMCGFKFVLVWPRGQEKCNMIMVKLTSVQFDWPRRSMCLHTLVQQ